MYYALRIRIMYQEPKARGRGERAMYYALRIRIMYQVKNTGAQSAKKDVISTKPQKGRAS